jgi:hypothetical protein
MPTLNLLFFLNAYSDVNSSNAPSLQNFRWDRGVDGIVVNNPAAGMHSLAASESRTIFSGTAVKKLVYIEADQNCTLTINGIASYVGIPAGAATQIVLTATTPGVGGNAITLTFTGSNTIAAAISTWNTAHPSNLVTLTSGDGTQIPSAGTTSLNATESLGLSPVVLGTFADGSPNNTPGMFLRTDSIVSLQITNESALSPCNVFVASVE